MTVVIDPQARGWHDDGTESGVVRTRPTRAKLVSWPLLTQNYQVDLSGTATKVVVSEQVLDNSDGTGAAISLTAPATASGTVCGARLWTVAYGSTVGVRFRRNTTTGDFTVWVDGVPTAVTGKLSFLISETVSLIDGECWVVVAEDLDPTIPHVVQIDVLANPTASNAVLLFGLAVDALAGYPEVTRLAQHTSPAAVPTSMTGLSFGSGLSSIRGVKQVHYYNSTAGALTVTCQLNAATFDVLSVPATSSVKLDFGVPTLVTSLQHQASSAGITYMMVGAY